MSREFCDICRRELETNNPADCDPDADAASLAAGYTPCAMIESRRGPLFVCETCYRQGDLSRYSSEDLYDLHYAFGVEYQALGRNQDALVALQKATGIDETADVLVMTATLYGQLGQTDREVALYQRALQLDLKDLLARRGLATALRSRGRLDEALRIIDEDLKELGALPDLLMERAELLHELGRRELATQAFAAARAAAVDPEDRAEFDQRWAALGA